MTGFRDLPGDGPGARLAEILGELKTLDDAARWAHILASEVVAGRVDHGVALAAIKCVEVCRDGGGLHPKDGPFPQNESDGRPI